MVKKTQRIVYILANRFHQRDYYRLGVASFINAGFDVEVWEILPYLNYPAFKSYKILDPPEFNSIKLFYKNREICDAIETEDESTLFMIHFPYKLKTFKIFRKIGKSRSKFCIIYHNFDFLRPQISRTILLELLHNPGRILDWIFYRFPRLKTSIGEADYCIIEGGKTAIQENPLFSGPETRQIITHHYDYELFSLNRSKQLSDTAVFLDELVCFHPDYAHSKVPPYDTPDRYYKEVNQFFDFLERQLDLEVVIASHPRSEYSRDKKYFGNRKIIKGKTIELVQTSQLILAHSSTSINFAVLCNKPIILLTNNRLENCGHGPVINSLAKVLKLDPINISREFPKNLSSTPTFNQDVYRQYVENYLKLPESPKKLYWDIVLDVLTTSEGNV